MQEWLLVGINWSKYLGNPVDGILYKKVNFLNHCLNLRESRPSSAYIFPRDNPLIAPVTATAASYCAFSIVLVND